MKIKILFPLLLISTIFYGQTDTIVKKKEYAEKKKNLFVMTQICIYKKYFYKNEKMKEEGCESEYTKKRLLITKIRYKRNGAWKEYNEDGSLRRDVIYKDDQLTGPYTKYYRSGKIHVTGQVSDSQEIGTMKTYDESGTMVSEIIWKLDGHGGFEMTSEKIYKKDAKPDKTIEVIDGETYMWQYGERNKVTIYPKELRKQYIEGKKK